MRNQDASPKGATGGLRALVIGLSTLVQATAFHAAIVPAAVLSVTALSALNIPAFAADEVTGQKFRAARAAGIIGEQADGYAAFVKPSNDVELKRILNEVNALRRSAYTDIAQANGQSVDDAGQVAAKSIIERLPAGSFVKDSTGEWKQK